MKLTKEDLIKMLDEQLKSHVSGDDFGKMVQDVIGKHIASLQSDVVQPFGTSAKAMISGLPFVKMDGDFISTKQGSIINMKNKQNPWVQVSEEMGAWAKDFANYLKTGSVSKLLSEGVDSAGGYLVPAEFRAVMIMWDALPTLIWQRATVWPMNGEKLGFPKLQQDADVDAASFDPFAGVSFSWTEEGGEKGSTQPNFGLVEMVAHELSGYTEVTNTLLESSAVNLVNFLTRIFRAAWYWITDKAFIQGTGGKQPLGIINDPSVFTVARQTATNVEVQDVLNMEAKLPAVFDEGSVWFISKKARANLRGQRVSANSKELVLQETFGNISEGYNMTILGRPAVLADGKIPALGSTGDVILGNWSHYYIGFPQEFAMDSSKHFQFRKNRTSLRCAGRVDGVAAQAQAFVLLSDPS